MVGAQWVSSAMAAETRPAPCGTQHLTVLPEIAAGGACARDQKV
jgi:hypothetical protein